MSDFRKKRQEEIDKLTGKGYPPQYDELNPPPHDNIPDKDKTNMSYKNDPNDFQTLHGTMETETAKAILFRADDWSNAEWLPKSACQIEIDGGRQTEEGHRVVVEIAGWLCRKNGWKEQ